VELDAALVEAAGVDAAGARVDAEDGAGSACSNAAKTCSKPVRPELADEELFAVAGAVDVAAGVSSFDDTASDNAPWKLSLSKLSRRAWLGAGLLFCPAAEVLASDENILRM
jgi:hypothetical protein